MATAAALLGDLFDAALGLPEAERLDLASRLLASVEAPADNDWDAAWLHELDRREREVRDGGAPGSEWSEVRARIRARLAVR